MTTLDSEIIAEIVRKANREFLYDGTNFREILTAAISEALSRARSVTEGETPRTDERSYSYIIEHEVLWKDMRGNESVDADFARDLERELNAALSSRIPSGELGELLKEVERLDQAATKGEWQTTTRGCVKGPNLEEIVQTRNHPWGDEQLLRNINFIAFARTALPRLARELADQIKLRRGIESDRDKAESDRNAYREAMEEAHAKNKALESQLADALARLGAKGS
jgi:hypothetical protein